MVATIQRVTCPVCMLSISDELSQLRFIRGGSLKRIVVSLFVIVAFLYAAACVVLFAFQRRLIYYPRPRLYSEGITMLTLPVKGERVLVSSHAHSGSRALIYFGGNAEDVSQEMPDLLDVFPERAIYLLHYRSYGGSTGQPSEKVLVSDALALFDLVHAEHADVTVMGRSLGSGVAVQLASVRPVERLILVTPFDSLEAIAARQFSFMPVRLILRDKFESWRYAPKVSAPTVMLAGDNDQLVPLANSERLKSYFKPGLAVLQTIAGAGHNDISEHMDYLHYLKDWERNGGVN